ncbi:MAG: hypothetical protein ACOX3S_00555 [Anaerolineae bacterium]|jgi:hypothetical protein
MDSGMISKIQKSIEYAKEPDRVEISALTATFRGNHDTYSLTYVNGQWTCQCNFFAQRGVCSHTMAIERLLVPMLRAAEPEVG